VVINPAFRSTDACWLLPASAAAAVARQWRDITRYIKIQQMSRGGPDRPSDSPVKEQ
jgi:hypothetical protein